jgi:hypothetical protein
MIGHFRGLWENVRELAAVAQDALQHFREVEKEQRVRESRRAAVDRWADAQAAQKPMVPVFVQQPIPKPPPTFLERVEAVNQALQRLGIEKTPFTPGALKEAAPAAIRGMLEVYEKAGVLTEHPDRSAVLNVHQAQVKRMGIEREGPELPGFRQGRR